MQHREWCEAYVTKTWGHKLWLAQTRAAVPPVNAMDTLWNHLHLYLPLVNDRGQNVHNFMTEAVLVFPFLLRLKIYYDSTMVYYDENGKVKCR